MSLDLVLSIAVASLAALIDLRTRRIPNWLTLGALLTGVGLGLAQGGQAGGLEAVAGAALGFALLLPFYLVRAVGAGDVKLLAGLGALLGAQGLLPVALYAAIVGGAISAVMLLRRGVLLSTFGDILTRPLHMARSGAKAPYGVAIATGVYLSMLLPGLRG